MIRWAAPSLWSYDHRSIQTSTPSRPPLDDAWFTRYCCLGVLLAAVALCPLSVSAQAFTDISALSGADDPLGANGLSFRDFDGDGDLDLAIAREHDGFSLLENLGDNRFSEILSGPSYYTRSVVWGDYDGDGDEDLLVVASRFSRLLRNDGRGTFTDVAVEVGIEHPALTNNEGAAWFDYDNDGDLDLVIDDHSDTELLRNDDARFTVIDPDDNPAKGFQDVSTGDYLAVGDFDVDGDVDILTRKGELEAFADIYMNTNGVGPTLFAPLVLPGAHSRNEGKGGLAFADYDVDGDFDLFYAGAEKNMLFSTQGQFVVDVTETALPGFDTRASTDDLGGSAWADVDGNTLPDLFLASESGENQLWYNIGGGVLTDVTDIGGVAGAASDSTRGAAFADTDGDGDLDLYVTNQQSRNVLYRNDLTPERIPLLLDITQAGRPALGAVVQFFAAEVDAEDLDADGDPESIDDDGDNVVDVLEAIIGSPEGNRLDPTADRGDPIHAVLISGGEGLGGQGVAIPYVYIPPDAHLTVRVIFPGGFTVIRDIQASELPSGRPSGDAGGPLGFALGIDRMDLTDDGDGLTAEEEIALGTSPTSLDSDNDGLRDGEEDRNRNGVVDAGETDPANADTDGDGILDGVELGRTFAVPDPDGAGPIAGTIDPVFDADPLTTTDPLLADTDGGGVTDGREDIDRNGRFDPGERDANDGADDMARLVLVQTVEDLDGFPNLALPGDRLRVMLDVRNDGLLPASSADMLEIVQTIEGAALIEGSVVSSLGRITQGNTPGDTGVSVLLDELRGGGSGSIRFDLIVGDLVTPGEVIRTQASARFDADDDGVVEALVVSDDPAPNADDLVETGNDPADPADDDPTLVRIPAATYLVPSTKVALDLDGGLLSPGDVLHYIFTLRNRGTIDAVGARIVDDIPTGVSQLEVVEVPPGARDASTTAGGAHGNGILDVQGLTVPAGGDIRVVAQVVVDFPLADGTEISNQATIEIPNEDPVLTDSDPGVPGQQATNVMISSTSALVLLKSVTDVDGDELLPGDLLRYQLEVVNAGTAEAEDIVLVDDMPPTVSGLVVESIPEGAVDRSATVGGAAGRGAIDISEFSLPGMSRATVTFTALVDELISANTAIVNQARVSSFDEPDAVLSDGDPGVPGAQPTSILVTAKPVLVATKEAIVEGTENPVPGETIAYVIVVSNEGTAPATGVLITDEIPEFTIFVPGTIQLNGVGQTDALDDDRTDFNEALDNTISIRVGQLDPGQVVTVNFQVQVDPTLTEPQQTIVNQAQVSAVEFEETILTNDPEGDGPTEIPIESPAPGDPVVDAILPESNPVTDDEVTIRFDSDDGPVTLSIYNLVGERVRVFDGLPAQGEVTWRLDNESGRAVANNTYVVVLQSPSRVKRDKLVVAR